MWQLSKFAGLMGAGALSAALAAAAWSATPAKPDRQRAAPGPVRTAARPALPSGDAVAGREKAEAERCIECHGVEGQGDGHGPNAEARFAKLAGQHPGYLVKQLQDFRSGVRKHDVMRLMTQRLEEGDLHDIAAYFASQPPMHGEGRGDGNTVGRELYLRGDAARGIVACASCHDTVRQAGAPSSAAPLGPAIGGQDGRYLEQQLLDWRSAYRTNSANGVMNQVTKALSDAEIRALADYLAGRR